MLQRLSQYLWLWGIPGLFGIAFLDAASIPLVGGPDYLVLLLACGRPMNAAGIVLAATVGSCLGYFILYRVARLGGEVALAPFSIERKAWVKRKLDQNAFLAVAIGVAAPPPFPTKLVILAAGACQIKQMRFVGGLVAGRLVRYSVLAYLAARFGDQALAVLKQHFPELALTIVAGILLFWFVRRMRSQARAVTGK